MRHHRGATLPASAAETKEWLRRDFSWQCAYCERTEAYLRSLTAFDRDHFRPRKLFPELEFDYANLYYCCAECNRKKGAVWPSDFEAAAGRHFIDPCDEDPYSPSHLVEREDGALQPQSPAGEFTALKIRLDRPSCMAFRRRRRLVRERIARYRAEVEQLHGTTPWPRAHHLAIELLEAAEREWLECYQARPLEETFSAPGITTPPTR
jgi:uncharacterized protein (TIGR02646 family)